MALDKLSSLAANALDMLWRKTFAALVWANLLCYVWNEPVPGPLSRGVGSGGNGLAAGGVGTGTSDGRLLQDIVTWDEHSLLVRGQRIMLFSGEFHPFRLPSPDLYLDVFQKLKAAGFAAVSFYTHWALLEPKSGDFSADGIFDLEPFFEAASRAGIYLIARPGPYINAEVTGGGFPGWLQRERAADRTPDFLPFTENYVRSISRIIAKAQITHGGPVILFQPENEYTYATDNVTFPNGAYMQAVEDMFRDNGIVVPFISNDAAPRGLFAPGNGSGSVDIYGHDGYPLGFDCANPYSWPDGALPTFYLADHLAQSPTTPYSIAEFQAGAFDPWGGPGFAKCTALLNAQFERVFYKNNYAAKVAIFNMYMAYGGTNWGNIGHPGGYTSYDYGAIIAEDRTVAREKYSETKLQANFLKVSPAYLTATPVTMTKTGDPLSTNGSHVDTPDLATAQLASGRTAFYVVRHARYNSNASTEYKLSVDTSVGSVTIPQMGGALTLNGRDSKIHVVDYDVGGINLLYSTAEIFTWKDFGYKKVLILYGGLGEIHEIAFSNLVQFTVCEGTGIRSMNRDRTTIIHWEVQEGRRIIIMPGDFFIYLVDRNSAYNYWVLDLPAASPADNFTTASLSSVIVKAGYLLRTATISDGKVHLTGDINATTTVEVLGGAPEGAKLAFNGQDFESTQDEHGVLTATIPFEEPVFALNALSSLAWHYIDSLPEIQPGYDDSAWVSADHTATNNTKRALTTPTSLYSSDYGFHTGNLLTRGHFVATGAESSLFFETWGGYGYASAVYLDDAQIDGFAGSGANSTGLQNITLQKPLEKGRRYVLTVLTDNMGLEEDFTVGGDSNKNPRGVVDYAVGGRDKAAVAPWKITGNLGGETYADRARGPLNEGGLFAERQGFHLPGAPTTGKGWSVRSPFDQGLAGPGVGFFVTTLELHVPEGYDVPMAFEFKNATSQNFRCQLYVNGYQFGKYVNNVGPQTSFPVPQGILDYDGVNTIALSLWGFDATGNRLAGLDLKPSAKIATAYGRVRNSPMPRWVEREGAY